MKQEILKKIIKDEKGAQEIVLSSNPKQSKTGRPLLGSTGFSSVLSAFLFCVLFLLFSFSCLADEIEDYGFKYDIDKKTQLATLTGVVSWANNITVPTSINIVENGEHVTYKVVAIGDKAFQHHLKLTSIIIPESVISIGDYAFNDCPLLESMVLSDNIKKIGNHAITDCLQLSSFVIPKSIEVIGTGNFKGCDNLALTIQCPVIGNWLKDNKDIKKVIIGDNVTTIGDKAFYRCTNLREITIPTNIVEIGSRAFCGSGLKSIVLPNSVKTFGKCAFAACSITSVKMGNGIDMIPDSCFYGCYRLESVEFTSNVYYIGANAFENCWSLSAITIPDGTVTVCKESFKGCNKLQNVTLGCTVRNIGDYAFQNCTSLRHLSLPKSVNKISRNAFDGCPSISFDVENGNAIYDSRDNCGSIIETATNILIIGGRSIPKGTIRIGESAFFGRGIKTIDIPASVTQIDKLAFLDCSNLKDVYCHAKRVPKIGIGAFDGIAGNSTLYVPTSSIRSYEVADEWEYFDNYMSLTTETSINQITYLADTDLETAIAISVYTNTGQEELLIPSTIEVDGIVCQVTKIDKLFVNNDINLATITISEGIKEIGESAFSNCRKLQTLNLPSTLEEIGSYAFWACIGLNRIVFPENLRIIGSGAFLQCESLTGIYLPESVDSIGVAAFNGCINMEVVWHLPNKLRRIEDGTFKGCTKLWDVSFPEGLVSIGDKAFMNCSNISHLFLPDSLELIGNSVFAGCTKLQSIYIPSSLTNIGNDAFKGCNLTTIRITDINDWLDRTFETETSNILNGIQHLSSNGGEIKSLWIPAPNNDGLRKINDYAFYGYKGLEYLDTWRHVSNIGNKAFYGCSNLKTIKIYDEVTSIGNQAFKGCYNLKDVYVYHTSPLDIDQNTFDNNIKYSAVLHVPEGCTEIYKKATNWSNSFEQIIDDVKLKYTIYYVSGSYPSYEEYAREEVAINSVVPPIESPMKEGYTFIGWEGIPEIMPEHEVTVYGHFQVNSYTITYKVDGEVYKTASIAYGTELTAEAEPTKEGYVFSGWSGIPRTMPAHDIVVTGSFTINISTLTYMVDGEEYKTSSIAYGTELTLEAEPTKEGYTFSGWSEIPSTMPAHDVVVTGSFAVNSYTLIYMVDGEEYKTSTIDYGTELTAETNPTMEGYTFSGWSEIPATMPAHDVIITGSFNVNSYTLTYMVDGEEYNTSTVTYGTAITAEDAPSKEGYTFSGWSEFPATMPAHDVEVTGTFSVNSYTLTYKVDGEVYNTVTVDYGASLTPETLPNREGYSFSGWSEIPATMPARDVEVTGTFSVNSYTVTFMYGDEVLTTEEVEYGAVIPLPESLSSERYTLVEWLDVPESMPAHDITIQASYTDGVIYIHGNNPDAKYYQLNGYKLQNLQRGINIIRKDDGTVQKVFVK